MKTKTEEIQYIGQMLTATEIGDKKRLSSIIKRLRQIQKDKK